MSLLTLLSVQARAVVARSHMATAFGSCPSASSSLSSEDEQLPSLSSSLLLRLPVARSRVSGGPSAAGAARVAVVAEVQQLPCHATAGLKTMLPWLSSLKIGARDRSQSTVVSLMPSASQMVDTMPPLSVVEYKRAAGADFLLHRHATL
jgi:hypothetical protein